MIRTALTEVLGLQAPLVQGGMQWVGTPALASAVTNAGALGILTALTQPSPDALRLAIRQTREMISDEIKQQRKDKYGEIAVNITILPSINPPDYEGYARAALEEGCRIFETAGNNPGPIIKLVKQYGGYVIHKCTAIRHAKSAERVGADMLSIDGFECAGHPGEDDIGGLVLMARAAEELKIPFIASGGIANGQGLAAALALGAAGANMGTRFMCTTEAEIHENVKRAIVEADERNTIHIFRTLRNTARMYNAVPTAQKRNQTQRKGNVELVVRVCSLPIVADHAKPLFLLVRPSRPGSDETATTSQADDLGDGPSAQGDFSPKPIGAPEAKSDEPDGKGPASLPPKELVPADGGRFPRDPPPPGQKAGIVSRTSSFLEEKIEQGDATVPLAWQAFLTGMVDMMLYSRSQVWLGFQTGNMVQFSGNIAQYIIPQAQTQPLLTLERILSVLSFFVASYVGYLGGQYFGHQKRKWLVMSSVIQSLFLWGAAIKLLTRPEGEEPSFSHFPPVIVLTAFSMGLQSIAAQKLVSPTFATTVAFTATLSQIASDPYLFALRPSASTRGRDRRLIAIVSLCIAMEVVRLENRPGGVKFEEIRDLVSGARGKKVYETGDIDAGVWTAGITLGLIHDIPTCKVLVQNIVQDAEKHINRLSSLVSAKNSNLLSRPSKL
ncbi:inosine monophosphate dehydrogenase [Violaceomyces palustris]|uniref:Inosine monophosphate dehydrogenase n=1 Tax=Violaceomyces palustris TaxID=1673888 RepID=A0ACD0NU79_9BASI|nr:inosine monophosphate dehydrogenase [Violaceomyces palustris]